MNRLVIRPLPTLLVLSSLVASPLARAGEGLTLAQALAEARSRNPMLARSRAASEEASWKRLEAASGNLPQLSASANHFFDERYQVLNIVFGGNPVAFPEIYPQTVASIDAAWTVFDGLKTPFAFHAAVLAKRAADLELRRTEFTVDGEVSLKFYGALAAQQLAEVALQNVKTLRDHLARTQELLNRGKATRFDTLRVETQLAEAEPESVSASDAVVTSRRELAVTIGLDDDDRELTGSLPEPRGASMVERVLKADLSSRDDIQALNARSDSANSAFHSSLGTLFPKFTFAVEKQWYNNTNNSLDFTSAAFGNAYSVGVFASWNLFDGGSSLARQAEAVHQREQSDALARAAALRAPLEFDTWRRKVVYEAALYKARQHAIDTANESVRLARLGYGAGTRTSTDVLDAELDLFRARAGMVRAQLDAVNAQINLELALGHAI